MTKQIKRAEIVILLFLIAAILLPQLLGTKEVTESSEGSRIVADSISVLNEPGTTIACLTGTTVPDYLLAHYPEIEIQYYNTNMDIIAALMSGKVDFGASYDDSLQLMLDTYPAIGYIAEPISMEDESFAVSKKSGSPELVEEFNAFLEDLRISGEYDLLVEEWEYSGEGDYPDREYTYSGEKGKLSICTCGVWEPMSFYYNNTLTGFYVELLKRFCAGNGYVPEFYMADFAAELAGIASGTYVFMADIVSSTPEREESAYMTEPMHHTQNIALCLMPEVQTETVSKASVFFSGLRDSFIRNFVTEERWKFFLAGLVTTAKMSVFSACFGLLLGAFVCYLRMSKNPWANALARLYIKLFQGIPILVLLMILYYLILSRFGVSAYTVCVIGFSLDFSSYCAEIYRSGIEAIPSSQMRAARALGFGKTRAFFRFILPQALIHIIPVLVGQFIMHVKMSSVAGYISVQDLTKVSDIIRSRTYEAFFPLITTAVVYFLIATALTFLLERLQKKLDPTLKQRIIKGVKLNEDLC